MRLFLDSFKEAPKGYDVQARSIGEALNLLRKNDAEHIYFGKLSGGEQAVDLAKFLVLLAKDGLLGPMTYSFNANDKGLVGTLSTLDFYTGVSNADGVKY